MQLRERHAEILADLSRQMIVDFVVARNGTTPVQRLILPSRMPAAFAQ